MKLAALVGILALAAAARADLVKVEYANGTGASPGEQSTATTLVRHAVGELGHDLTEDGGAADYTLRPSLLKLNQSYILGLEKIEKGRVRYSGQLKAAHLDELDTVALRLTRSVIAEKRAASDTRVDEVTEHESRSGIARRPARHVRYLGFGGAWLGNLQNGNLGYSFGAAWGWDVNRAVIKLLGEFAIAGSALFGAAGLGADLFFTMTDIAPYVSADFGFGFTKSDGGVFSGATANGFQVGFGGGLRLLRSSEINVDLGARYGLLLTSNAYGTPSALTLRLGVYF